MASRAEDVGGCKGWAENEVVGEVVALTWMRTTARPIWVLASLPAVVMTWLDGGGPIGMAKCR